MTGIPWPLFIGASLALIVVPGQDLLLVMSRGIGLGPAAGVATAAGVGTGLLGHSVIAAFGLGAVLAASEIAFTILKYVGAAYLVYLGARMAVAGAGSLTLGAAAHQSRARVFLEGALSNLSNPKVTLFYFAFLPQFVPASSRHPATTVFLLGVMFAALTFLIKGPVGFFAGNLSGWIRGHPRVLAWIHRSSGLVLVGLGLRLAFVERR